MRLFIAFELPEHVKEHLVCFMESLKTKVPRARWVKKDELHITAAFIGETDPDYVPIINEAMEEVSNTMPLVAIELAGIGAFPTMSRASVLWAGITNNTMLIENVKTIRDQLAHESPPINFDKKLFKPHITLARFKSHENLSTLGHIHMEPLACTLQELILYETVWLYGGGHRYEKLSVFTLQKT